MSDDMFMPLVFVDVAPSLRAVTRHWCQPRMRVRQFTLVLEAAEKEPNDGEENRHGNG